MSRVIDLTGQRFGRLTVIKRAPNKGHSQQASWECLCDCGNTVNVVGYCLRNGDSRSCGCYYKETRGDTYKIHGKRHTRIYNTWCSMKERCNTPSNTSYKNYGARGITVCSEWQEFEPFYEWAMSHGYTDELSIDRIDVNGNYSPDNCRWVTKKTQANNTRANHYVTRNGVTHTVTEWCEILGISRSTVVKRIAKKLPEELWFYDGRLPKRKEL